MRCFKFKIIEIIYYIFYKMASKLKSLEKNGSTIKSHALDSVWARAFTSNSEWPDKVFVETYMNTVTGTIIYLLFILQRCIKYCDTNSFRRSSWM